jgi:ATP-dependent RNA helicase DeaD
METKEFKDYNLSPEILRALDKKGYYTCTPVQAESISPMMSYQDLIAKAPTGTGKTFAFGIPILEHIDPQNKDVQALILAPTRELALQITTELQDLSAFKQGVRIVCVYGGQPFNKQLEKLKKNPQIIVATPGRLLDHVHHGTVTLEGVQTAVLDEADRMLDMGFYKEVTGILDMLGNRKNLALLSATLSREVMTIGWLYQRDPVEVTVQEDIENKPDIKQFSLNIAESEKIQLLSAILTKESYKSALVFCNTKVRCDRVGRMLIAKGFAADSIHGDIRQEVREKVLRKFREGTIEILVATDVAARGIDVEGIEAVFNYDIPQENGHYIHRIGRTGRAKRQGVAYTFISGYEDAARLKDIIRYTRSDIQELPPGEFYRSESEKILG